MDNGEAELSDHVLLQNVDSSSNLEGSASVNSFFGEFLKNTRTCTHTHTCNPPGPDAAHTHTCYHTHTQTFSSEDDEKRNGRRRFSRVKRPLGNREAVRKYREKKKAHTAYLEEEVQKLRAWNQHLDRKLQGQALLEAEVIRLRSLLVDLRGKIDNELGAIPFQKPCNSTSIEEGDCKVQSGSKPVGIPCSANQVTGLPCFHPHTGSSSLEDDCRVQSGSEPVGIPCSTGLPCFHPHTGSSSLAGVGRSDDIMVIWPGENCQPAIGDSHVKENEVMNSDKHNSNTVEKIVSTAFQVEQ